MARGETRILTTAFVACYQRRGEHDLWLSHIGPGTEPFADRCSLTVAVRLSSTPPGSCRPVGAVGPFLESSHHGTPQYLSQPRFRAGKFVMTARP